MSQVQSSVQRIERALLQLEHLQQGQQLQRSLVAGRLHWVRNQLQIGIQKAQQENVPRTLPKQMLHLLLDPIPNATEALIRRAAPKQAVVHELRQLYNNVLKQIQVILPETFTLFKLVMIFFPMKISRKSIICRCHPEKCKIFFFTPANKDFHGKI